MMKGSRTYNVMALHSTMHSKFIIYCYGKWLVKPSLEVGKETSIQGRGYMVGLAY